MNSAPNRFWNVVTNSAERSTSRRRARMLYSPALNDAASTRRSPVTPPPATPDPSATRATTPANDSATPVHCRAVLCSRSVNTFSTATKIGMVAIRIAAALALVRAMPRFSKVK